MCITGFLADFSLPEIFQLLDKGRHTGLLTLYTSLPSEATYYVWVYRGCIVAVADCSNRRRLVELIAQNQWGGKHRLTKLVELCPSNQPLGLYLKQQGVLQTKHLKGLFQVQVMQPMRTLFQLKAAQFRFEHNVQLPAREMTGLSLAATAITLMGLRSLSNWDALAHKLPDPNGGLISANRGSLRYRLDTLESQVWEYTNGTVSLKAIAQQLRLPLKKVQQIAFRLIAVGLAEEIPLIINTPTTPVIESLPTPLPSEATNSKVSHSFLHNLMGFLSTNKSKKQSLRMA